MVWLVHVLLFISYKFTITTLDTLDVSVHSVTYIGLCVNTKSFKTNLSLQETTY